MHSSVNQFIGKRHKHKKHKVKKHETKDLNIDDFTFDDLNGPEAIALKEGIIYIHQQMFF
jgi:hypothetical protein